MPRNLQLTKMASNIFRTKADNSQAGGAAGGRSTKPQFFNQAIADYEDKLPVAVEVIRGGRYAGTKNSDNVNVQLLKGDILWVTKTNVDSIAVSTETSAKRKESAVLIPPDWSGKFQIPSSEEYPVGHVFNTVAELATDFPLFVTVREEFTVDAGVTVKSGQRLKLLRRQKSTSDEGKFLQCDVEDTGESVLLPEDMSGKFEKSQTDTIVEMKDLSERLPLHAMTIKDDGDEGNGSGAENTPPGIPENSQDENLLLTSVRYAEALLWETSNENHGDILKIPDETKMEVIVLENWEEDKGPPVDIMELAKVSKKGKNGVGFKLSFFAPFVTFGITWSWHYTSITWNKALLIGGTVTP